MAGPNKVGVDWAAIEAGWRAGETMGSLGRRHGVSRQAISKRARKEGWTPSDDALAIAATTTAQRIARPVTGPDHRLAASGTRSPAVMQRVLDILATGGTIPLAARRIGMSPDNLRDWLRDDEPFRLAADAAAAEFGSGLVERIADAGKRGDWRADAHLLDRHPATRDEFGPRHAEGVQGPGPILIQINAPGFTGGAYGEALKGRIVGETTVGPQDGRQGGGYPPSAGSD